MKVIFNASSRLAQTKSKAGWLLRAPWTKMGEDIDKHVLRKYEVQQKLGKGVNLNFRRCLLSTPHHEHFTGVWRRVEIGWQEDTWYSCSEKDIRCISECYGRSGIDCCLCCIHGDSSPCCCNFWKQRTFREIMFLQEVNNHENIIRCHLLFPQTDSGTHSKLLSIDCTLGRLLNVLKAENDRDIYLIFEYMETDLHAGMRSHIYHFFIHKRLIFWFWTKDSDSR